MPAPDWYDELAELLGKSPGTGAVLEPEDDLTDD